MSRMSRLLTLAVVHLALLVHSVALPAIASAAGCQGEPKKAWTVLVFMVPNPDLDEFVTKDLAEMLAVGSTSDLNIVVQVDTPTTPKRLFIPVRAAAAGTGAAGAAAGAPAPAPESCTPPATGPLKQTLTKFVQEGFTRFPSDHRMLVLWGHSKGVGLKLHRPTLLSEVDEPSAGRAPLQSLDGEVLALPDVAAALNSARGTKKIDILGFDSCFMSAIEVGYQFRNQADYMVASQDLVPHEGWPYAAVLNNLAHAGTKPTRDVALAILADARTTLTNQTVLDLNKVEPVAAAMKSLVTTMAAVSSPTDPVRTRVKLVFDEAVFSQVRKFIDLDDLATQLELQFRVTGLFAANAIDRGIKTAALSLSKALKEFKIDSHNGAPLPRPRPLNGISVYYPIPLGADVSGTTPSPELEVEIDEGQYRALDLNAATGWLAFVKTVRGSS